MERCYYFLHACVETAQRKEPVDGRLVQFLLSNPTNDGGQWDMLVNLIGQYCKIAALFYIFHSELFHKFYAHLSFNSTNLFFIEKYGVIPKKSFPESHSSEASRRMNDILNHKVGGFTCFVIVVTFSVIGRAKRKQFGLPFSCQCAE